MCELRALRSLALTKILLGRNLEMMQEKDTKKKKKNVSQQNKFQKT